MESSKEKSSEDVEEDTHIRENAVGCPIGLSQMSDSNRDNQTFNNSTDIAEGSTTKTIDDVNHTPRRKPPPLGTLEDSSEQRRKSQLSNKVTNSVKNLRRNVRKSISTFKDNYQRASGDSYPLDDAEDVPIVQPLCSFKYHVLKFGKDLYLSTNPDKKHITCRQGPSYYVTVENLTSCSEQQFSRDFKLKFRDPLNLETIMTVEKYSMDDGVSFYYELNREFYLETNTFMNHDNTSPVKGTVFSQPIQRKYFPFSSIRLKNQRYFKNFETSDCLKRNWNIGSIPKVRLSRLNNFKEEEYKLVEKRNIYFHQNYTNASTAKYKQKDLTKLYNQNSSSETPPVLSIFKPCRKYNILEKLKTTTNKSKSRVSVFEGTRSLDAEEGRDSSFVHYNVDDEYPNENKLGWITIHEDLEIFGGFENKAMFNLVLGLTLAVGYESLESSCISNKNIPFTGYKVEYQLNIQQWNGSYHLLYCHDNKLIYDTNLNDSIPWTKSIDYYDVQKQTNDQLLDARVVIMARRKSFALRNLPIYLPNTLVGSLFHGSEFEQVHLLNSTYHTRSIPLLASNILNNWLEMNYKLQLVYHVPILTTPGIDSKRFNFGFFEQGKKENNWDHFINIQERYSYNYDSRVVFRQAVDNALNFMGRIIDSNKLIRIKIKENLAEQNSAKMFWKLILLSKSLKSSMFEDMIVKIDKYLKY